MDSKFIKEIRNCPISLIYPTRFTIENNELVFNYLHNNQSDGVALVKIKEDYLGNKKYHMHEYSSFYLYFYAEFEDVEESGWYRLFLLSVGLEKTKIGKPRDISYTRKNKALKGLPIEKMIEVFDKLDEIITKKDPHDMYEDEDENAEADVWEIESTTISIDTDFILNLHPLIAKHKRSTQKSARK